MTDLSKDNELDLLTEDETDEALERPPLFRVLLHNDHYTTREFVVEVLHSIFHKSESEAVQIMLHVHHNGVGVAGIYPFDIAETKIRIVEHMAKEHQFPLRLTMEPEDE